MQLSKDIQVKSVLFQYVPVLDLYVLHDKVYKNRILKIS